MISNHAPEPKQPESFVFRKMKLPPKRLPFDMPNSEQLTGKLMPWLDSLGLSFNPFDSKYLDAGADPFLASYLVGHQAFLAIRQDQPSMVFAPVGGGKTAFRVRLARACRVGEDGRRILPVTYTMPKPNQLLQAVDAQERQLYFINQRIAAELFLALAYRPEEYLASNRQLQRQIVGELQANFPGELLLQLDQIESRGELLPLVQLVDPSADRLIAQPAADMLREFCAVMRSMIAVISKERDWIRSLSAPERFQRLVALAKDGLGFQAIYLLIDGVDAYVEATTTQRRRVSDLLTPLLQKTGIWARDRVYAKYFLPTDFLQSVKLPELLTEADIVDLKLVRITWTKAMLNDLLQERLRFASQGRFTNLDAICTPPLRGVQDQLIAVAASLPREVLSLAERMLLEHVWRMAEPDFLEPTDFAAAVTWYQGGGR